MFLVGGAAYSGTTLLAVLLNQPGVTCLNEPDFHDPAQNHNGLPVLKAQYPGIALPSPEDRVLDIDEAVALMSRCQALIAPDRLSAKFCNRTFLDYARVFHRLGLPVVAIVRDVRDALVRPLLPYVGGEAGLVARYREIWAERHRFDAVIRYEDLVADPAAAMARVGEVVGCTLATREQWSAEEISEAMMYPRYRHYLLQSGRVSDARVGVWRRSGRPVSDAAQALATEMGYD